MLACAGNERELSCRRRFVSRAVSVVAISVAQKRAAVLFRRIYPCYVKSCYGGVGVFAVIPLVFPFLFISSILPYLDAYASAQRFLSLQAYSIC